MSNEKKPYTVQPGHAVYDGRQRNEGDTVHLTAADAERLGDAVKPAKAEKPKDPPKEQAKTDDPLAKRLEGNVEEATADLETLEDADLAKLAELETAGKGRKGVLDAIEAEQAKRAQG